MDICLPDGSGMECVRTLRENGYEGSIIFQSSSAEHTVEAFQVDAIQYLLKPVSQEQFFAAVDRAASELTRHRKTRSKTETWEVNSNHFWQDLGIKFNLIIPKCQEICYNANLYQTLFAGIRQKGVGFMGKDLKDKELGVRENRKCPGNCVVLCVVII